MKRKILLYNLTALFIISAANALSPCSLWQVTKSNAAITIAPIVIFTIIGLFFVSKIRLKYKDNANYETLVKVFAIAISFFIIVNFIQYFTPAIIRNIIGFIELILICAVAFYFVIVTIVSRAKF